MKKHPRVILSLIIDGKRMIKRSKFKNYKYLGDPLNIIRIFNSKRVDEISIISCENYEKKDINIDFKYLEIISGEAFCPLTYSGGVRSLEDADKLFSIGFEKIGIRNLLHTNPEVIKQIAEKYGSQSVVIFIDYKELNNNEIEIYTSYNSFFKSTKSSILKFIKNAESYGAGEVVLQSILREGQSKGLDLDIIKKIANKTMLPIISSCGLRDLSDARKAFLLGADGVMASKFFSLYGNCDGVLLTYPTYQDIQKL